MQFCLREKNGTRKTKFALKMLSERCLQMQRGVYLCFIKYKKAFDEVQHKGIMQALNKYILEKEYVQLIKSLYWNQNVAV